MPPLVEQSAPADEGALEAKPTALPATRTVPCESCGHRPTVVTMRWAGAEPFRVCVGCAPAQSAGPASPDWSGVLVVRRSARELAWPVTVCGGPPSLALVAWLLSHDPLVMVASGVGSFIAVAVLDLRRPRTSS